MLETLLEVRHGDGASALRGGSRCPENGAIEEQPHAKCGRQRVSLIQQDVGSGKDEGPLLKRELEPGRGVGTFGVNVTPGKCELRCGTTAERKRQLGEGGDDSEQLHLGQLPRRKCGPGGQSRAGTGRRSEVDDGGVILLAEPQGAVEGKVGRAVELGGRLVAHPVEDQDV